MTRRSKITKAEAKRLLKKYDDMSWDDFSDVCKLAVGEMIDKCQLGERARHAKRRKAKPTAKRS